MEHNVNEGKVSVTTNKAALVDLNKHVENNQNESEGKLSAVTKNKEALADLDEYMGKNNNFEDDNHSITQSAGMKELEEYQKMHQKRDPFHKSNLSEKDSLKNRPSIPRESLIPWQPKRDPSMSIGFGDPNSPSNSYEGFCKKVFFR
jgi:hypothetical protein